MAEENHTQMLLQQQQQTSQQQQNMQQQNMQQSQMQQQQMQQSQQIQQQQMQQTQQMQQQTQQQAVTVSMPVGNTVEQTNQMNVTTSVPINVATINVSQAQQMQTIQQSVNTSSGQQVQMAVPQLTAQAQTVQAGNMISQSSGPHPTMIHPTMTMAQSPLQHVQVIQQPLSAHYLQNYLPQQQMVFPGNLTLQHAGMTTNLQSIGASQGLSLQLQAKPAIDPKNQATGQTLQAVNTANKNIVNTGTMMTASGQVIGTTTQKANYPQQMMAAPGKSTIIHSQSGFATSNPNQTVVIAPVGVLPNQQNIFNHKSLADQQKGKTYAFHSQPQTLQPKSLYSTSVPVHSSTQVFNGAHLKQITSQPQIITTQSPSMFSQAQIFGSFAQLPQGLSWATPGNFQSPTLLTQNPIILSRQQSDMFIQSPQQTAMHIQPVAPTTAPVPPTSYAATAMVPQKHKQVRVRPGTQTVAVATQTVVSNAVTINANTPSINNRAQIRPKGKLAVSPFAAAAGPPVSTPQMATTQTQTNQSASQTQQQPQPQVQVQPQPQPQTPTQLQPQTQIQTQTTPPQPKSDAANQTLVNQTKLILTPETKSPTTHSKSVGVEAKQLTPQLPVKSQAMVAPSTKVMQTAVSSTVNIAVSSVTASPITTTVSITPVVSSTVQSTATVSPIMTSASTEISTSTSPSPPPSSLLDNVEAMDASVTDTVAIAETPIKETEQPKTDSKAVESEPTVPQPIIKPPLAPVKDKQPPQKAIVKPQVLTHVIDGFVIQEGSEPFPVSRSSLLSDSSYRVMPPEKPKRHDEFPAASPKKKPKIHSSRGNKELANCEFCGILGEKSKFKRSKRFCSISCAKGRGTKRMRLLSASEENVAAGRKRKVLRGRKSQRKQSESLDDSAQEVDEPNTPVETEQQDMMEGIEDGSVAMPEAESIPVENSTSEVDEGLKSDISPSQKLPTKWSVQDVFEFIRDRVPGCSDYADVFRAQEIDGQALLLLKEDHLMTAMCMKLGPALKLISHINSIKEELSLNS